MERYNLHIISLTKPFTWKIHDKEYLSDLFACIIELFNFFFYKTLIFKSFDNRSSHISNKSN